MWLVCCGCGSEVGASREDMGTDVGGDVDADVGEDAAPDTAPDDTADAAGDMREAYIRILLTRGIGDLSYDVNATPTPTLIIIVKPFDEPPARVFTEGIRISLVSILRNHPGSVNPIIKSNNLLNNVLAMQEAHRRGGEEGLSAG